MVPLNAPHRLALLAAVALAAGALGPWATGVWHVRPIMQDDYVVPRVEHNGAPLVLVALVAASVLLLARDERVRARLAAVVFGFATLLCVFAWTNGEYDLLPFDFEVFAGWRSVGPGWGLVVATVASAFGALAAWMGAPRHDPWRGAPF